MKYTRVASKIPGPKSKKMIERWKQYEADKTGYQAPVAIDHGEGALLYDVDGNCFIDYTSGVLVANTGHCHPKLVNTVKEVSSKILNVYEYCNQYRANAARDLVKIAPKHLEKCFFFTSGSEATDSAMRIMKRAKKKYEILTFFGGFHGRTQSTASAGGIFRIKKGFGPTTPGIIRAPFPYCYRCPFKSNPENCNFLCLEFIDELIMANSTDSLAGLIIEPYLGTAGFIFPPKGYLKQLEKWSRERGLLFTLDEVQSSFGRIGEMWAMDQEKITPDIVTVGKGLGGGVPVSALLIEKDIIENSLKTGELGSTFGGNPVSCAAISEVIKIIKEEKILGNVQKIGKLFKKRLSRLLDESNYVGDIRGRGLVYGIELVKDKKTKEPAPELLKKLILDCSQKGLLIGGVGLFSNVVRIAPPLVINEEQADESLKILSECIRTL